MSIPKAIPYKLTFHQIGRRDLLFTAIYSTRTTQAATTRLLKDFPAALLRRIKEIH